VTKKESKGNKEKHKVRNNELLKKDMTESGKGKKKRNRRQREM
jgi:hypothetical protein